MRTTKRSSKKQTKSPTVRQPRKIKGKGLPTLLTPKCFSFHEKAKVPESYKALFDTTKAVDIIMKLLTEKFAGTSVMDRLYFLNARTGSGKSTTFISHLYDEFIRGNNCKMYVTEPRVPLCSSNASEIIRWKTHAEDEMGKNVGYLTGPSKVRCDSQNGILYYCTPQIIANQLNNMLTETDIPQKGYIKIVVIDESHLLDMPTLQTLNIIFNVLEKFGNDELCPLFIFASATLNLEPFINYYFPLMKGDRTDFTTNEVYEDYKMIGYVSGSANFKVDLKYLDKEIEIKDTKNAVEAFGDYMGKYIVKNTLGLMLNNTPAGENGNDLLVFVPKMAIAGAIMNSLKGLIEKTEYNNEPVPVFNIEKGMMFTDVEVWRNQHRNKKRVLLVRYARGFAKASDEILKTALEPDAEAKVWERKIFVSTPIIETGKTIASLRYCFDTGLELKPSYNPLVYDFYNARENLRVFPINQSSATQRLGRVGREQTGECLRLYTENVYNKLEKSESPETVNNFCLSQVLLAKLQTLPLYQYHDLINDNNYLFKISTDIQLRTICDLINSGFYNLFGYVTDTITPLQNIDTLTGYIQQLYYIKGYSLFKSLLTIHLNFKNISPEVTPMRIPLASLHYDVDKLKDISPDMDVAEAIKKARNTITLVMYDPSFKLFKYMYSRTYNSISRKDDGNADRRERNKDRRK